MYAPYFNGFKFTEHEASYLRQIFDSIVGTSIFPVKILRFRTWPFGFDPTYVTIY